MPSRGEQPGQLAKGLVGAGIVVDEDVVRRQVVERFFGPRVLGELLHQRLGQPHVLGVLAQLACGGEVEEAGLGPPGRAVEPGTQGGAGTVEALEIVVALGQTKRHQLVVIRGGHRQQGLERVARLCVAARGKQPLRAFELLAVACRAFLEWRPRIQIGELGGGGRRQVAERIHLVQPGEGLDGTGPIAGGQPGAAEP